jgi:hypothetical protein
MKFTIVISFFIFTAVAAPVILLDSSDKNTVKFMNEQSDSTKLSLNPSWFETQLGIYIPVEYMTIDPAKYTQELREGTKDTLAFEYWLGGFTIKAMDSIENCITVNFSTENHTRVMFITPNYFVLTSYMPGKSDRELTYGSSLIYFPENNTLKELDTIIVYSVKNNTLICSMEHYNIGEPEYKEFGRYDVTKSKFTKQNK